MNKTLSLIIIGLLCASTFSMFSKFASATLEPPAVEWSKTYPQGDGEYWGDSLIQTNDGGYAIASRTAEGDFQLIKTDSDGNVQWVKTYGLTRPNIPFALVQTSDGGYAIAGDTDENPYAYAWLVKTDSSGNMQWNKVYTEVGRARAWSLVQTDDGGYAIAGAKWYYDGWMMKTDASGTMQWSKSFVEINNTQLVSIFQTNDGGYIAAGATQFPPFTGKSEAYVVKTDPYGNIEWNKTFSGSAGHDYGNGAIQTNDGGYAIACHTDNTGNGDAWLIKIDVAGNLEWDKKYGGTGRDTAYYIVQTSDGGYAMSGETSSYGAGGRDFLLIKTDNSGNMQWNQTYGGASEDWAAVVITTSDGGYALSGYTTSFGGIAIWLIKLAGAGAPPPISATVDIYPSTLNLRNMGKWITAYIELPPSYNSADINVSSILLNNTVPAASKPMTVGDYDGDGIPDLMVKFNRAHVRSYILSHVNMTELIEERFMTITLTLTGKLYDGTPFQGSDTIRIIFIMPRWWRFLEFY